ncbi:MAG: T9SS type A sorting domain-containing protein [Flavobacteriales bacterium]
MNAQENNHWQLGSNGLGMHFNGENTPDLSLDGYTPYGWSGCGVLNNQFAGNLVFYTDGQKIIDRTHQIMPNGDNLIGGNSTHGTGKICARIGYPGQYYVFSIETATESSSIESLYYSIVDTTLAGNGTSEDPLGDILEGEKNIWLHGNVSESLELIKGEEGQIWLLNPRFYESIMDVFLIDSTGINLHSSFDFGVSMIDVQAIRYSSSSHKLALGSFGENDPILIFDFDHISGELSNPTEVPGSFGNSSNQYAGVIDLEWSPDGSKLYISKYRGNTPLSGGKLFQYDLENPNLDAFLLYQVSSTNTHVAKGLRLGPDGNIYWLYVNPETGSTDHIAAILNPNEVGSDCNLDLEFIESSINLNYTNLFPNSAVEYKSEITQNVDQLQSATPLMLIFPQPSRDFITIKLTSIPDNSDSKYSITNASGNLVAQSKFGIQHNQFTIDISPFASGLYTLTVFSGNIQVSGKFIKN